MRPGAGNHRPSATGWADLHLDAIDVDDINFVILDQLRDEQRLLPGLSDERDGSPGSGERDVEEPALLGILEFIRGSHREVKDRVIDDVARKSVCSRDHFWDHDVIRFKTL